MVVLVVALRYGRRLTRSFSLSPTLTLSSLAELYFPPFTETWSLVMRSWSNLVFAVEPKVTLSMVTFSNSLLTSASAAPAMSKAGLTVTSSWSAHRLDRLTENGLPPARVPLMVQSLVATPSPHSSKAAS